MSFRQSYCTELRSILLMLMLMFILQSFLSLPYLQAKEGDFIWAKATSALPSGGVFVNNIRVDNSGNIYVTGSFLGTVDFDPGVGQENLVSAGGNDIFISKLDSNGNFLWAKSIGGTESEFGNSIASDNSDNIYVTGEFRGTVDFDPGNGVQNQTSIGNADIFIWKLDSDGNYVWAFNMGSTAWDGGADIAVDPSGNICLAGTFAGTVDFDPGEGATFQTSTGGYDVFISKFDSNGNLIWVEKMGGSSDDFMRRIDVDNFGNIHTIGTFKGVADFDPSVESYNLVSTGGLLYNDIFISKLDNNGVFVWAKSMGGPYDDYGSDLAVDSTGNVYSTGSFENPFDFDPSEGGTFSLTSVGAKDIFICKLDSNGDFVWARAMGGTGYEAADSIALNTSDNIFITGNFENTVDFDPGDGELSLNSIGSEDIFICKVDSSGNLNWAKSVGGNSGDTGRGIAVDTSGNIIVTGMFQNTVDFDPGPDTFNLSSDMFSITGDLYVLKLTGSLSELTFPWTMFLPVIMSNARQ